MAYSTGKRFGDCLLKRVRAQVQDGSKGVKVGKRIAVLAEETDDLDSLELPQEDSEAKAPTSKKSVEPAQETSATKEPPQKSKPSSETAPTKSKKRDTKAEDRSATKPSSSKSQTQKYPLYPSVQMLLHSNGLSSSEANKIPATGPNGRLLKGDVLAHLGRLSQKNYAGEQSERIKELGHLDLSNIKKAIPKQAAKKEEAKKAPAEKIEEPDTQVTVPISLVAVLATQKRIQDSLGLHLPLSTFIARASELANEDLPRGRSAPATSEELFDAVLGLDKIKTRTSRGNYVPQITVLSPSSGSADVTAVAGPRKKMDIIDLLSGNKALGAKPREAASSGATGAALTAANNAFSVSVKKGDEKRARVYLERIKTVLEMEPGQLVL